MLFISVEIILAYGYRFIFGMKRVFFNHYLVKFAFKTFYYLENVESLNYEQFHERSAS